MHCSVRLATVLMLSVFMLLGVVLHNPFPPDAYAQEPGVEPGETLQTNPKSRGQTVTASVSDTIHPSTPILVSPEDNSLINESLVTFVWSKSTDEVGVNSYTLFLDGAAYIANIPTSDADHDAYVLDYDGDTGYYTLTVTQPIDEGQHTWHIVAFDAAENQTSSVTWSFSVDSLAPTFIITQVGNQEVSISAQEADSIPDSPIILTANSPLLLGTGEPNASGTVTIWLGSEQLDSGDFSLDSSGTWSIQLGILPRDVILTLNFTLTDAAGNVSILNDLSLIIQTEYFQIPPLPSTQPDIGSLPSAGQPTPTASLVTLPGGIEIAPLVIKKLPPVEIASTFITQASEILPDNLRAYVRLRPLILEPGPLLLALFWLPVLLLTTPVTIAALLLWGLNEGTFTLTKLRRMLQALGLWPWWGGQAPSSGLVIESVSQHPVAFARVIITGTDQQKRPVREILITNQQGEYYLPDLSPGVYQAYVDYPGSSFPSATVRPDHIPWYNQYRGENMVIGHDGTMPSLVIPIDPTDGRQLRVTGQARLLKALALYRPLSLGTFLLACVSTALYPSAVSLLVLSTYLMGLGHTCVLRWLSRRGLVTDEQEQPLPYAVIRLYDSRAPLLAKLAQTDENGRFSALFKGSELSMQAVYFGWKLAHDELTVDIEQREQLTRRVSGKQLPPLKLKPPTDFLRE